MPSCTDPSRRYVTDSEAEPGVNIKLIQLLCTERKWTGMTSHEWSYLRRVTESCLSRHHEQVELWQARCAEEPLRNFGVKIDFTRGSTLDVPTVEDLGDLSEQCVKEVAESRGALCPVKARIIPDAETNADFVLLVKIKKQVIPALT